MSSRSYTFGMCGSKFHLLLPGCPGTAAYREVENKPEMGGNLQDLGWELGAGGKGLL